MTRINKAEENLKTLYQELQNVVRQHEEVPRAVSETWAIALHTQSRLKSYEIDDLFGLDNTEMRKRYSMPARCCTCGQEFRKPICKTQNPELQCPDCLRKKHKEEWKRQKEQDREERRKEWGEITREAQQELVRLKNLPYDEYLKTDWWKACRATAMRRARGRCQLCNRNDRPLHVHHRTYERRGEEFPSDLTVLCESCHEKTHGDKP
jgi:hypothetical protein